MACRRRQQVCTLVLGMLLAGPGLAEPGRAQPRLAQPSPAQPSPAPSGLAEPGPAAPSPAEPGRAQPVRWSLSLEGGAEYDTNIHRFETFPDAEGAIVAAPLARGAARLRMTWRPDPDQALLLSGFGAGKLFATPRGQDENMGAVAGDGRYQRRLPGREAVLAVRGSYHDSFGHDPFGAAAGAVSPRHFSVAGGEASLALAGPDGHRITLWGGYRRFRYKPDHRFSWTGEQAGARYQTTRWLGAGDETALDIAVSYGIERRGYRSAALYRIPIPCPGDQMPESLCQRSMAQARTDLHHAGAAEIVYTDTRIYSARYEAQVTDSNSYGYSVVRQRVELGVTTELFARVFATARAELQIDAYLDSLLLARDVQSGPPDEVDDLVAVDGENRSALALHLARDIGHTSACTWSMEGRYAMYLDAIARAGPSFRRQLFYLGAVCRYGS